MSNVGSYVTTDKDVWTTLDDVDVRVMGVKMIDPDFYEILIGDRLPRSTQIVPARQSITLGLPQLFPVQWQWHGETYWGTYQTTLPDGRVFRLEITLKGRDAKINVPAFVAAPDSMDAAIDALNHMNRLAREWLDGR